MTQRCWLGASRVYCDGEKAAEFLCWFLPFSEAEQTAAGRNQKFWRVRTFSNGSAACPEGVLAERSQKELIGWRKDEPAADLNRIRTIITFWAKLKSKPEVISAVILYGSNLPSGADTLFLMNIRFHPEDEETSEKHDQAIKCWIMRIK